MMAAEKREPLSFQLCGAEISSPQKEERQTSAKNKHQGWITMPFIIGNETFERLASFGLSANLFVYLTREFHLDQVSAANLLSIWWGITNFTPLFGAFLSDAYLGRFKTIGFSSFSSLLGLLVMTLTAWLPKLRPPKCDMAKKKFGQCKGPNKSQLGVLLTGLGLLSMGTGGIRPCSIPFGVDQFDPTTEEGVKGINSFFNWYYASFNVILLLTQTVLVYVQDRLSWVIGFGVPTLLMLGAIILFFIGTKLYVYVEPDGSIFSGIAQVFVAAYQKRWLKLPEGENDGVFYDPPLDTSTLKLALTKQFRFLNKAAMMGDNELKCDATPINPWRLCSIQQVEDVKCLIRIIPIWASGFITFTTGIQQSTFVVSQALKMDRHLGPKFEIPAGSISAISFLTVVIWVPIYDRFIVPALRKITKHEGGITVLQRCGLGIICSCLSMLTSALVERKRRAAANLHPNPLGIAPLHVIWLSPQIVLLGLCESFFIIGMIEFLNKQFPDHMKSIGNALQYFTVGVGSYLSSLTITLIHKNTGKHGRPDWLTNDINAGKLDYFYFLVAGLGFINLIYFIYWAHRYRYKGSVQPEVKPQIDLELPDSITP